MLKVGWVQFVAIFLIFYAIVRKVRARRRARGRRRRAPAEAGRGAKGPAPLTIRRRPARASVRPPQVEYLAFHFRVLPTRVSSDVERKLHSF